MILVRPGTSEYMFTLLSEEPIYNNTHNLDEQTGPRYSCRLSLLCSSSRSFTSSATMADAAVTARYAALYGFCLNPVEMHQIDGVVASPLLNHQ